MEKYLKKDVSSENNPSKYSSTTHFLSQKSEKQKMFTFWDYAKKSKFLDKQVN